MEVGDESEMRKERQYDLASDEALKVTEMKNPTLSVKFYSIFKLNCWFDNLINRSILDLFVEKCCRYHKLKYDAVNFEYYFRVTYA